MQIGLTM
jgi:hypothetical protein